MPEIIGSRFGIFHLLHIDEALISLAAGFIVNSSSFQELSLID